MITDSCTVQSMTYLDEYRESLSKTATELDAARSRVNDTLGKLRAIVKNAHAAGMSELEIHNLTGISRTTVRVWLGK